MKIINGENQTERQEIIRPETLSWAQFLLQPFSCKFLSLLSNFETLTFEFVSTIC